MFVLERHLCGEKSLCTVQSLTTCTCATCTISGKQLLLVERSPTFCDPACSTDPEPACLQYTFSPSLARANSHSLLSNREDLKFSRGKHLSNLFFFNLCQKGRGVPESKGFCGSVTSLFCPISQAGSQTWLLEESGLRPRGLLPTEAC